MNTSMPEYSIGHYLGVHQTGSGSVMGGSRPTVAIGSNLHLVAVSAIAAPSDELHEGVIYSYELTFDFADQVPMSRDMATLSAPLAYPPFERPTFCLPSSNLNTLRLLQGSCRIPHGNGKEALDLTDFLLALSAENPAKRPQQMLLTGDQIYADDVAPAVLLMLTDAADAPSHKREGYAGWSTLAGSDRAVGQRGRRRPRPSPPPTLTEADRSSRP